MRVTRVAAARVAAFTGAAALAMATVPAQAADNVGDGELDSSLTSLTLLNTNDFHGHFTKDFACAVVTAQTEYPDSTFLSAGDNVGGTPFESASQDDNPSIDFLNALGLKASAVGNHEFDKGMSDLTGRISERADWTYLGANVYKKGTQTPALDAYTIIEQKGVKIAVVGAVTKQVPSLVAAAGISGLDFGDPVAAVNRVTKQLKDGNPDNGEADVVIAEYHEGAGSGEDSGATLDSAMSASSDFRSIVEDTDPGVDAIFTGHTHQLYDWDGKAAEGTRPVIQTGFYAGNLGILTLGYDPETKKVTQYKSSVPEVSEPTPACESNSTYTNAAKIVDNANTKAEEIGKEKIGSLTADITTAYNGSDRDDRGRESTLSNMIAQSYVDSINKPGRSGGVDIGVMNPGGVRAELLKEGSGDITYADAASIMPFNNTVVTKDLTGAQFRKVLEQQWQPDGASRPFLKLGLSDNVTYTYDPQAASGSRITSVTIDGKPLSDGTTYKVASNSFLLDGGDDFTAFSEGTNTADSGLIDQSLFVEWIKENSPLTPSFAKNGVAVTDQPSKLTAGEKVSFTVSDLDLTSLSSPKNTSLKVKLGDTEVADVTVDPASVQGVPNRSGSATVTFTVPADAATGSATLTLTADPSTTVVTIPVEVYGTTSPTEPTSPTTEPTDPTDPTDGTVTGPPVQTDGASHGGNSGAMAGLAGAGLLLGGAYLVARRRVTD
ncbi:5'-nucleotidase C-terminal domain-containing protein [Dermacoccaceae bacterium W4C1]